MLAILYCFIFANRQSLPISRVLPKGFGLRHRLSLLSGRRISKSLVTRIRFIPQTRSTARMMTDPVQIKDIKQLRQFVSHTLCKQNDFEEGIFQVTERILTRGTQPCGIFFCLHGPRSVKLTAVWETEKNSILFYGSTGERFKKTVLLKAPSI